VGCKTLINHEFIVNELWTLRLRDTSTTGQFAYCLVNFAYWTVCLLDISPTIWTVRLNIALHVTYYLLESGIRPQQSLYAQWPKELQV